jgi:hypothetical protein
MQQRQLRLGDILDDYCPRERRLTNHAIVAMVGDDVKQTRCTTCDAEHEYKHARVPRQRKKDSVAGLQAQVLASGPKRVVPDTNPQMPEPSSEPIDENPPAASAPSPPDPLAELIDAERADGIAAAALDGSHNGDRPESEPEAEGPAHRRLIRAQLPRTEGQPPPARPAPDFTIRHPGGGRPGRFRPRQQRGGGGQSFQGNRSGQPGGNQNRGGTPRNSGGGRAPMAPRPARRHHDSGRKRSR